MAKKPTKSDRQAVIDEIRKKQKGGERRRGFAIASVVGLVAVLIVAAAAYRPVMNWWDLRKLKGLDLASIGAPASVCEKVETEKAEGEGKHEPLTEQITYDHAPPAFGSHWSDPGQAPVPISRKFYTEKDRPELEALVHNLEHGYTLLWYDETAAEDSSTMTNIQAIADKFHSDPEDFGSKFIAVPWTSGDTEGERELSERARRLHPLVGGRRRASRACSSTAPSQRRGPEGLHGRLSLPGLAGAGRVVRVRRSASRSSAATSTRSTSGTCGW